MRTLFAALDAEASNFAEVPGTGARRAEIVLESERGKLPIAVVIPPRRMCASSPSLC
ncbi:MAG: hypothetical protein JOZ14_11350, partial [Acidobacteria bacterium]|nr:hypothetical protein [Acidobacteriota bacterium]